MKKFEFNDTKFYINSSGDGPVSGQTVGVSKFRGRSLIWNRRYKPEKIIENFLRSLI